MDLLANAEMLEFDRFRLDFRDRTLFRLEENGRVAPVAVGARAFDLLCVLVCRPEVIVTKSEIMDAVWPGLAVEDSNLTVQMSALRRILDQDRAGGSCIQTVSGRGYRFLPEVRRPPVVPAKPAASPPTPWMADTSSVSPARMEERSVELSPSLVGWWHPRSTFAVAIAATAMIAALLIWVNAAKAPPPRLSIAILPFSVFSGSAELARLADGITEDLTSDLTQLTTALVSPRQSALRFKDQPIDLQKVGHELNVRYALTGSLRRLGAGVRASVALASNETGATLWVDQLDIGMPDGVNDQEQIAGWLRNSVTRQLIEIEAARSARERPNDPDARDLFLQAQATVLEPPSAERQAKAQVLHEQALKLDPTRVRVMTGLASTILSRSVRLGEDLAAEDIQHVKDLIASAEALAPTDPWVLWSHAYLLRVQERWPEAEVEFEHTLDVYPHFDAAALMLGICKLQLGQGDDAVPLFQRMIRNDPHSPDIWAVDLRTGEASLFIGRYDEAVRWIQRSLAADPEQSPSVKSFEHALMASAYALAGHIDRAREEVSEADSLGHDRTVRGFMAWHVANEVVAAQIERVRDGLRLAGMRDHVDENEDFGIVPSGGLRTDLVGHTPLTVPGATVIKTPDLAAMLHQANPVVIDASQGSRTLAGAVNLSEAGFGGTLQDQLQDRLRLMMATLTKEDPSRPTVALGQNAETWTGYNLALRLVALGYRNVFWYRGGREAWDAAGLPLVQTPQVTLPSR